MMTRRLPRRGERGETLIEFALSLTLYMVTVFGTLQLGLVVWQYNMLSNLAQEGARWASVRGAAAGASAASASQVQTFVQGRSLNINPIVSVFSVDATSKACTATTVNPAALNSGQGICVRVTKTLNPFTRIVPRGAMTFSSTAQMIMLR